MGAGGGGEGGGRRFFATQTYYCVPYGGRVVARPHLSPFSVPLHCHCREGLKRGVALIWGRDAAVTGHEPVF